LSGQSQHLLHNLPEGVLVFGEDGTIAYANLTVERLSGFVDDDLVGRAVGEIIPDDVRESGSCAVQLRKKDGSAVPVEVRVGPIAWDGEVMSVATVRESHGGTSAQQALRASEKRYRALVESLPLLLTTNSLDGRLLSINKAFDAITGWDRDDWVGRHYTELMHPAELQGAVSRMPSAQTEPVSEPVHVHIRTASGRYRTLESWSVPLVNGDTSEGVMAVSRDITDLLHAEKRLRRSEARFRGIFEASPLGIVVVDTNEIIIDVNPAMCRMLGLERHHFLGASVADLTESSADERESSLVARLTNRHGCGYQTEKTWKGRWGAVLTSITSSFVTDDHGAVLYGLHLVEDISERRRMESELAADADLAAQALSVLTPREQEVMDLASEGVVPAGIADRLSLSARTVESHLASVYRKLGVRCRSEACGRFMRYRDLAARDPRRRSSF
jgi:PAS domain S-box-containing protein